GFTGWKSQRLTHTYVHNGSPQTKRTLLAIQHHRNDRHTRLRRKMRDSSMALEQSPRLADLAFRREPQRSTSVQHAKRARKGLLIAFAARNIDRAAHMLQKPIHE